MPEVIIYTTPTCPYCVRAKELLKRKGQVGYREIDITRESGALQQMLAASGGRKTVPQIIIGGRYIGGCDDLYALDRSGELDQLLS